MSDTSIAALLSVDEAIRLLDATPVKPRETVVSLENAAGLRLARPVSADRDFPFFDKSLMDGFAVRSADLQWGSAHLTKVDLIPAGKMSSRRLESGQAMAIMTGAPLPDGADGVVPVEDTESDHDRIHILRSTQPGRYIARRGSDCRAGQILLPIGTRLGPAQLAVASSVGATELTVFARPKVGVLATGDEIVPLEQNPGPAQLRNSNSILLLSLLKQMGCETIDLGIAADDPMRIRHAIESGLSLDALFITGGMSMGQFDFVPKVLQDIGATLHITKLRIKPGKPFVFASLARPDSVTDTIDACGFAIPNPAQPTAKPQASTGAIAQTFIFGLPGNPVSAFVCTLRLASRLIRRMLGADPNPRFLRLPALSLIEANGAREFYLPGKISRAGITPLKWKGSADIFTLAQSDALILRPENAGPVAGGETVDVLEIDP